MLCSPHVPHASGEEMTDTVATPRSPSSRGEAAPVQREGVPPIPAGPMMPENLKETGGAKSPPPVKRLRVPLWLVVVAATFMAVAVYVYIPSLYQVETDDAYIEADTVSVVPKVAAYVTALHVTDNSTFKLGELLVELDPRDFLVAVDSATASLQGAEAQEANAQAQLSEQNQVILADEANVQGDQSTLAFARQQLTRFRELARDEAGTVEEFQSAQSNIGQHGATLQKDSATLSAAEVQIAVLGSQVRQAAAMVARAQAGLAQAKLNLSYTKIYADGSGTVANRAVQAGNFVQPGQTLFSAVPDTVYIIANFKETQLTNMKVGQPVSISVDAFPHVRLRGHVDSFQRGTGSNFALLPPENATGNFVKVVQRIPVKIVFDEGEQDKVFLAPGMSVETAVTEHTPPSWLASLLPA
jgi:membrane fusion protein, multidrug efflux system